MNFPCVALSQGMSASKRNKPDHANPASCVGHLATSATNANPSAIPAAAET